MSFWKRLFGPKSPPPAPPPDPREVFFAEFEKAAHADPHITEATRLEDGQYGMKCVVDGKEVSCYLSNLFATSREESPEDRARRIQHFLESMRPADFDRADWEEVRPRILPVLRSPFAGHAPVSQEILPFLLQMAVIDLESSMTYVTPDDLTEWEIDADRLFTIARENLQPRLAEGVTLFEKSPTPIWHVESGDDHESSRLLHPAFLPSFAEHVKGQPIAIAPERSQLFIAGDADPATVERLCDIAEREYMAASRSLSMVLYTHDDKGRLIPYVRKVEDTAAQRVREAYVQFAGTEYQQQKANLRELPNDEEDAPFIASYSGIRRKSDSRLFSYCTWSTDVEAYLPETDLIAVNEEGAELVLVTWADALRLAAEHLTRVPDLYPPRYRTPRQVPAETIQRLRAAAIELERL